ncbi:spore germination protein GerPB [Priestia sp. OVS21]|nr:spore germination protein GerPB [Priestia sp. OVS21]
MNFYVNQSICIQSMKISAVSNSSVLQIGSVGVIKPNSNLFNTGGFTGAAPTETKKAFLDLFPLLPLLPEPVRALPQLLSHSR